jgi:two-component system chemotaxis response regulator CheY
MISSKTTFLTIDDYSSIRIMIKTQLKEFGFKGEIFEAENVDQAIAVMNEKQNSETPIQFIISDWNMPGKSGLDFLKWCREQTAFKTIPFLMLTTENEQDHVLDAIKEGASNYLIKPWSKKSLSEKIAKCWEKHNPA